MYAVREALGSFAAETAAISSGALARLDQLWDAMRQISHEFEQTGEAFLEGDPLRRFLEVDLEFRHKKNALQAWASKRSYTARGQVWYISSFNPNYSWRQTVLA